MTLLHQKSMYLNKNQELSSENLFSHTLFFKIRLHDAIHLSHFFFHFTYILANSLESTELKWESATATTASLVSNLSPKSMNFRHGMSQKLTSIPCFLRNAIVLLEVCGHTLSCWRMKFFNSGLFLAMCVNKVFRTSQ